MPQPTFTNDLDIPFPERSITALLNAAEITSLNCLLNDERHPLSEALLGADSYADFIVAAQHGLDRGDPIWTRVMQFFGAIIEDAPINVIERAVPTLVAHRNPTFGKFLADELEARIMTVEQDRYNGFVEAWPGIVDRIRGTLPSVVFHAPDSDRPMIIVERAMSAARAHGVPNSNANFATLAVLHAIHARGADAVPGLTTLEALAVIAVHGDSDDFTRMCISLQSAPYAMDAHDLTPTEVPFATEVARTLYDVAFMLYNIEYPRYAGAARMAANSAVQVQAALIEAVQSDGMTPTDVVAAYRAQFDDMAEFAELTRVERSSLDPGLDW